MKPYLILTVLVMLALGSLNAQTTAPASEPATMPASAPVAAPTTSTSPTTSSAPTSAPAPITASAPTATSTPTTSSAPTTAMAELDPAVLLMLRKLEAAGKKTASISAELDFFVDMPQVGDTERRTGTVCFQNATDSTPAKFLIHFDTIAAGKAKPSKEIVDYAFDGEWFTARKEKIKQMQKWQIAPPGESVNPLQLGKGPFPIPFGQKAEDVVKYFEPTLVKPNEKADPPNTYHLKLVTRKQHKQDFTVRWLEMWADADTDLPVKIVSEDKSDNVTTVKFIKPHAEAFAKDKFQLPIPPLAGEWEYKVYKYGEKGS